MQGAKVVPRPGSGKASMGLRNHGEKVTGPSGRFIESITTITHRKRLCPWTLQGEDDVAGKRLGCARH